MSIQRVAAAYAKSLIDLSEEKNSLDKTFDDMVFVAKICDENRELRTLLASPIVSLGKKQTIIDLIFKGKLSEMVLSFFHLIIKKRREEFLYFIVKEFIKEYKTLKGIIPATLYTATEIESAQKEEIMKLLPFKENEKLELNTKVDPTLLGGFILKTDSTQIDASVRSKLNKIEKQFSSNPYISKL